MILCEKCRQKLPNPDEKTFDFDSQSLIYPDGKHKALSPGQWRFLSILLAAGPNKPVPRTIICDDLFSRTDMLDIRHYFRQSLMVLRQLLKPTKWKIENINHWAIYLTHERE